MARAGALLGDLDDPTGGGAQWTGFLGAASTACARAVFAFPVRIGAIGLGTMDPYRDKPGQLTSGQLRAALLATDTTAEALLDMDEGHAEFAYGESVLSIDEPR